MSLRPPFPPFANILVTFNVRKLCENLLSLHWKCIRRNTLQTKNGFKIWIWINQRKTKLIVTIPQWKILTSYWSFFLSKLAKKSLQQLFVYILSFFIYFITKVFEKEDLIIIELKSRLRLMNESPKVFHFLSLLFWWL